jgi:hypothetical protein
MAGERRFNIILENDPWAHPASHLDPPVNRRIAEVAVQYRLGLLPNGRARIDFCNRPNHRLVGKDLR